MGSLAALGISAAGSRCRTPSRENYPRRGPRCTHARKPPQLRQRRSCWQRVRGGRGSYPWSATRAQWIMASFSDGRDQSKGAPICTDKAKEVASLAISENPRLALRLYRRRKVLRSLGEDLSKFILEWLVTGWGGTRPRVWFPLPPARRLRDRVGSATTSRPPRRRAPAHPGR